MEKINPRLIIAYGNPGRRHHETRSNVGYIVVDSMVKIAISIYPTSIMKPWIIRSKYMLLPIHLKTTTYLVKPRTYKDKFDDTAINMFNFYDISTQDLYIIIPDKSMPLGEYEITKTAGATPVSILKFDKKLEDANYWRIRVGSAGESEELTEEELAKVNFAGEKMGAELELFNPMLVKPM